MESNSFFKHRDEPPIQEKLALRVLLVGNYPPDKQESMFRFARALLEGLRGRGIPVELIAPEAVVGGGGVSGHAGIGKWLGYVDKFILFPWRLRRSLAESSRAASVANSGTPVVHICDHSNSPYVRCLQRSPHLVTCHDLLAVRSALGEIPQNRTRWPGRQLQKTIVRGLNRAMRVACVSEATRADLRRLSTLHEGQVSVIPNALNYPYSRMCESDARPLLDAVCKRAEAADPGHNFILHVGGNEWYKNRLGVLRIYARLKQLACDLPALVMVGKPLTDEMRAFIAERRLNKKILEAGACGSEELRALYSTAGTLLFPSLAEGFGWPVIEAQACGCPVVCSSVAPFPEVAGTGAVMVDPSDETAFAEAIRRLAADPGQRGDSIEKGYANASRFAPSTMISRYVDCYASLALSAASRMHVPGRRPPREASMPVSRPA